MARLRGHPGYGASWEGFALEQTLAAFGENDAYFWATQRGAELDLLLLRQGRRYGFEFKCADAPSMTPVRAKTRDLIEIHLRHEPEKTSKSRIKRLAGMRRPQYRLRIDEVRVFYDVGENEVRILAVIPKSKVVKWLEQADEKT